MSSADWSNLIGEAALRTWIDNELFQEQPGGRLSCRFRVISLGQVSLVMDPLDDTFRHRVHIGQDSLNMVEFLLRHAPDNGGRALDVGTGSGVILIAVGRLHDEALGVDINPRAVRLAGLNVELNRVPNCRVQHLDIFQPIADGARFDLITWNTPFVFQPDNWKDLSVDGYGGHLGIEITLRFVERLPSLLSARGSAYLLSAAPRMKSGENRMEGELRSRAEALSLDITADVLQSFWVPGLRAFHASHGVRYFESVMLAISPGSGRVVWRGPRGALALTETLRRWVYEARRDPARLQQWYERQ